MDTNRRCFFNIAAKYILFSLILNALNIYGNANMLEWCNG